MSQVSLLLFSVLLLLLKENVARSKKSAFVNTPDSFIVGGTNATLGEFPYQGLLKINRGGHAFICGCSLLNSKWVITAAHCTVGLKFFNLKVYFGRVSLTTNVSSPYYPVFTIHQHPSYNASDNQTRHDISLLYLASNVTMSKDISPIALSTNGEKPQLGQFCNITGWGRLGENGSVSQVLQKAQVPIMNNSFCRELYVKNSKGKYKIYPEEMCAGYVQGGIDACNGDSGGPLACMSSSGTLVLQGITSFGEGCARPGLPGVYTRVSSYVDWIEETMKTKSVTNETMETTTMENCATTPPKAKPILFSFFLIALFVMF